MAVKDSLTGLISGLLLDRPWKNKSADQVAEALALSGRKLERTFAAAPDRAENRRLLSHIIGIERWGQNRLRVALGAPLVMDEYDGYRPPQEATWEDLQAAFGQTRQETVALASQFGPALASSSPIPHNQFGPLTVRSWLRYLDVHASLEAKKLKS